MLRPTNRRPSGPPSEGVTVHGAEETVTGHKNPPMKISPDTSKPSSLHGSVSEPLDAKSRSRFANVGTKISTNDPGDSDLSKDSIGPDTVGSSVVEASIGATSTDALTHGSHRSGPGASTGMSKHREAATDTPDVGSDPGSSPSEESSTDMFDLDDDDPAVAELASVKISGMDDDDGDDTASHGRVRGRRWTAWVLVGVLVLLCAGLGVGVWYMNHPASQRLDNSSTVGGSKIGSSNGSDPSDAKTPVADVSSFMDDEGVPKYYQQPESKVDQPTREQITKDSIESAPANAEMSLMSKASNPDLTDDPSKAQNEDGTLNPNYSYVTMDNVVPLIRDDLERLVNSLYGGWSALQDPGRIGVDSEAPAFPGSSLADMFDPSIDLSSEESLRRHVPLVADWDSDGFGGALASKDPSKPIVGVIDGYDCEFDVRGEEGDHVSCTAQVSYSWKDLYGKSHDLGGRTLGLDYKVNYDDPGGRRLLLTSVTQQ